MPGHVNMMDDVLISQLPAPLLRSSLRALISQGSAIQKAFVEHVRSRIRESPPPYTPPSLLFPSGTAPSSGAIEFLASTRCLFTSKLVKEAIPYLTHFLRSIREANARWKPNDSLEATLERASGDIIQAGQALKESLGPLTPTSDLQLQSLLLDLNSALEDCNAYCLANSLSYPFTRARRQIEDIITVLFPSALPPVDHVPGATSLLDISIDYTTASKLECFNLGPFCVPRLFNGLWQMSSPAWGSSSSIKQEAALSQLIKCGFVATDMADHYGDAELIYGSFRNRLANQVGGEMLAATKWCIFRPLDEPVTQKLVLDAVKERSRRLGGRVELLQFHWYNYEDKNYLLILSALYLLTKTHPHLVSSIGLCNFDAEHTQEACEYLLAKHGCVGIVSNQVQYSLIDSRPLFKMSAVCKRYGVKLLTYGSFCGGFLSEKWLGRKSPDIYSESAALTPSQRKYFDMISLWGSWTDLQALLHTMKSIADNHGVGISNVAARWVLDHPEVGAVIVGTRLGVTSHAEDNLRVFSFELTQDETQRLEKDALGDRARTMFERLGDCGREYQH